MAASRPDRVLVAVGGGYLRNPVRVHYVTCVDCTTPVYGGYERCYVCTGYRSRAGLADATAFLTYAVAGQESGYLMRGYKARPPVDEHRLVVGLLLRLALGRHLACVGALAGQPVTSWTAVPSLPARAGEHPLRGLIARYAPGGEVPLLAATRVQQPRTINPDHFACALPVPSGSHALVIDDTWATGGHAQSAALALRKAGAAWVSVLVVARWLNEDYKDNKQFIAGLRARDYTLDICPWTGGGCP
jgi:hypothetical protein